MDLQCPALQHGCRSVENNDRAHAHIEELAKATKKSQQMCIGRCGTVRLSHGLDELQEQKIRQLHNQSKDKRSEDALPHKPG